MRKLAILGAVALIAACTASPTVTPGPSLTASPTTTSVHPTAGPTVPAAEFPDQPEGVPWPTDAWALADLPVGVDRAAIDAATDRAFADGGVDRVRAVVIVHGGAIVYERYSPNSSDGPDVVMPSHSLAKSVTSARQVANSPSPMYPEPEIPAPGNYRRRRGLGQASPHALQATFQRFSRSLQTHQEGRGDPAGG